MHAHTCARSGAHVHPDISIASRLVQRVEQPAALVRSQATVHIHELICLRAYCFRSAHGLSSVCAHVCA